jgi:putative hemolysin
MTPRSAVSALDATAPPKAIRETLEKYRFGRLPVHDGSLDSVKGYVVAREVLLKLLAGAEAPLDGIVHDAPFFPESAEAAAVLKELQLRHVPLGFVVDEQGGFTGLVSLEDLVEEVVGEIFHEREAKSEPIHAEADGSWIIDGRAAVRDVNRTLNLELPEDPTYATVAGLVLHRLGHIPGAGEVFVDEESEVSIEVVESTPRRVARVRLKRRQ